MEETFKLAPRNHDGKRLCHGQSTSPERVEFLGFPINREEAPAFTGLLQAMHEEGAEEKKEIRGRPRISRQTSNQNHRQHPAHHHKYPFPLGTQQ